VGNCLSYRGTKLVLDQSFVGRKALVGETEDGRLKVIVSFAFKQALVCAAMAQYHQRLINSNAGKPGRKSRVSTKSCKARESTLKRSLRRIFRILFIA